MHDDANHRGDSRRNRPAGYSSGHELLADELRRVHFLVAAQVVRWRMMLAQHKPSPAHWGMLNVSEAEVDAFLDSRPPHPGEGPLETLPECDEPDPSFARHDHYVRLALAQTAYIHRCLELTNPRIRRDIRLTRLRRMFDLDPLEYSSLILTLLSEYDPRYRRLFAYLQDDAGRTRPTVELLLQILAPIAPQPAQGRSVFSAGGVLVRERLIQIGGDDDSVEPLPLRSVRLDDRIAAFLLADAALEPPVEEPLDGRIAGPASLIYGPFPWSRLPFEDDRITHLFRTASELGKRMERGILALRSEPPTNAPPTGAVLLLHGPRGAGRLPAARAVANYLRRVLVVVDLDMALRSAQPWPSFVALVYREALLRRALVVWRGVERLLDRDEDAPRWDAILGAAEAFPGVTFLVSEQAWDPSGRFHVIPFLRQECPAPNFDLRVRLWLRHLPWTFPAQLWPTAYPSPHLLVILVEEQELAAHKRPAPLDEPDEPAWPTAAECPDAPLRGALVHHRMSLARELANSFQLTEGRMVDALAAARAIATGRDPVHPHLRPADLFEACRHQSGQGLSRLARRIEPRRGVSLDTLVLPESSRGQIQELIDRVAQRGRIHGGLGFERRLVSGRGVVALFSGPSGTGKTLAAELLAADQGVDLYKVDLSAIVSKWVGETEKHLAALFAEAESSNAVILFDEADALFGRRGEIKEAQDRWANLEVNYLLQRIEEYTGVVVLTTNFRQNIDDAFLRRIHVLVEFPFPGERERLAIWMGLFPRELQCPPRHEVAPLASRFELAGGSISNIVVDAAVRALARSPDPHSRPKIGRRDLVLGIAREYQKLGRAITASEFGGTFYQWVFEGLSLGLPPEDDSTIDFTRTGREPPSYVLSRTGRDPWLG